jgi:hypothetical protein
MGLRHPLREEKRETIETVYHYESAISGKVSASATKIDTPFIMH